MHFFLVLGNLFTILLLLGCYVSKFISPEVVWPFSILEILMLPLLILQGFWFIFWIFRTKLNLILLNLAVICLGYSDIRKTFIFLFLNRDAGVNHSATPPIRILSLNVKLFDSDPKRLLSLIDSLKPDVACLQEVVDYTRKAPHPLRYLKEKAGFTFQYFQPNFFNGLHHGFGILILSRHPILVKGEIPIHARGVNGCIFADILVDGKKIRIYNVHLESVNFSIEQMKLLNFGEEDRYRYTGEKDNEIFIGILKKLIRKNSKRAWQAGIVKGNLNKCGLPFIVCTDLNSTPYSYSYRVIANNLQDHFLLRGKGFGFTYHGALLPFRIDYILSSPGIKIHSCRLIRIPYSDHSVILSEVSLHFSN